MPWETFTVDHVLARLYEDEAEAYRQVSGADHIDRLKSIVTQTSNRFRGAIRANPNVTSMGASGTLPDFCIFDAAVIARTALVGLSPVQEGVTDPRREEYKSALKLLESLPTISEDAFKDEPDSGAADSGSYGGTPIMDF